MFVYPQHAPAGGPPARPRFQAHLVLETTFHFRLIVDWKRTIVSGSSCIGQFSYLLNHVHGVIISEAMKIQRRARVRRAIRSSFTLSNLTFSWSEKEHCVIGTQLDSQGDFSTNPGRYDFEVRLSGREISQMLAVAMEAVLAK